MPPSPAAIELVLDEREIQPGERVALRLVNRGEVELMTGLPFIVEKWDGQAWTKVRDPSQSPDTLYDWPMVGLVLRPGQATEAQHWPHELTADLQTGQYRITKTARYEGRESGTPGQELTAEALFEVKPAT